MTNEELVAKIKAGETEYIEALWSQTCAFAYSQAGKFYNTYKARCQNFGIEYEDIKQECYFAILEAVEGFQFEKDVLFLTYAGYCLKRTFFSITKMNYTGWQNNPIRSCSLSLDEPVYSTDEETTLASTLADNTNIEDEVVNKLWLEGLTNDLTLALGTCRESWREVIYNVYYLGLRPAEIARRKGVARTCISRKRRLACAYLAKMPALQAYRI